MKYKDWLAEWLDLYVRPTAKVKTIVCYESLVRNHILPSLGEYELDNITPIVMQRLVTNLLSEGKECAKRRLSANSANLIITIIQNSLKTAYMLGYISEYSTDKVKRPKIKEKKVESFTIEEQKKIERFVLQNPKTKLFGIIICLYTGLRIGELLALEWSDVDFIKRELSVCKTCADGKNEKGEYCRLVDTPKTESSIRIVPLPKQLIPHLKEIKNKNNSKYVVGGNEKVISIRSYQRSFELLLRKLNIPHKGFHALRHTFATRALECGMDVKTLSEILGHKSPTVTLNRYAHSMMDHKKEMMNRLGKLF